MTNPVQGIIELLILIGDIPRHWRGFLGTLISCVVAAVVVSVAPSPWNYISGAIVVLVGFYLSYKWDVGSRRRGKAPPAGGWR